MLRQQDQKAGMKESGDKQRGEATVPENNVTRHASAPSFLVEEVFLLHTKNQEDLLSSSLLFQSTSHKDHVGNNSISGSSGRNWLELVDRIHHHLKVRIQSQIRIAMNHLGCNRRDSLDCDAEPLNIRFRQCIQVIEGWKRQIDRLALAGDSDRYG